MLHYLSKCQRTLQSSYLTGRPRVFECRPIVKSIRLLPAASKYRHCRKCIGTILATLRLLHDPMRLYEIFKEFRIRSLYKIMPINSTQLTVKHNNINTNYLSTCTSQIHYGLLLSNHAINRDEIYHVYKLSPPHHSSNHQNDLQ